MTQSEPDGFALPPDDVMRVMSQNTDRGMAEYICQALAADPDALVALLERAGWTISNAVRGVIAYAP